MFNLPLLLSEGVTSLLILVGVVALMGIIVLGVILFKKKFKKFDIEKPDITEEEAVQQELDRVLVPVDEELVEKKADDGSEEVKKD